MNRFPASSRTVESSWSSSSRQTVNVSALRCHQRFVPLRFDCECTGPVGLLPCIWVIRTIGKVIILHLNLPICHLSYHLTSKLANWVITCVVSFLQQFGSVNMYEPPLTLSSVTKNLCVYTSPNSGHTEGFLP